nr:LuxR C-terminal-related transcriptional regulator [Sphingomonas hankyongi]
MRPHGSLVDSVIDSPVAMVITNPNLPDNPIEIANAAFSALTGYEERDVVGRNCRLLGGDGTEPWARDQLGLAVRRQKPALVEILNYRKDGTAFRNGVMVSPIFDASGQIAWFLGSQVDLGTGDPQALGRRRSRASALVSALPLRQRQVLQAMANGLLNKQIAYELGIAEKTVKMHRALMLERLDVATSAEAIRIAVEAGL